MSVKKRIGSWLRERAPDQELSLPCSAARGRKDPINASALLELYHMLPCKLILRSTKFPCAVSLTMNRDAQNGALQVW